MQDKAIIGLGNPGTRYAATRHNVGFRLVDALAEKHGCSWFPTTFDGWASHFNLGMTRVWLAKPTTYMNRSGQFVAPFLSSLSLGIEDLLVVYDDLDLSLGRLRLARKGSSGGHNGLKSLAGHLESEAFGRLKLGIGHPRHPQDVVEWVLTPFSGSEEVVIGEAFSLAINAVQDWVHGGMDMAMNRNNGNFVRYTQDSEGGN